MQMQYISYTLTHEKSTASSENSRLADEIMKYTDEEPCITTKMFENKSTFKYELISANAGILGRRIVRVISV
jgi:hypothetical protein